MAKSLIPLRWIAGEISDALDPLKSRVGAIINQERPSFRVIGRTVPSLSAPLSDFSHSEVEAARTLASRHAPSIGCIKVQLGDGSWMKVGTAFRVPGGNRRMVTAQHVTKHIMKWFSFSTSLNPFGMIGGIRNACVAFDDEASDHRFTISKSGLLWAHPKWDMLVFDLDQDPNLPPLEIETNIAGGSSSNSIAIISYPIEAAQSDEALSASVIGTPLGVKRLSIGVGQINQASAPVPPSAIAATLADQHDATTLHGSSGAPVFNLATGKVTGLHFHGRNLHRDFPSNRNFAVNLPLAMSERALEKSVIDDTITLLDELLIQWDPSKYTLFGASESAIGGAAQESLPPILETPIFDEINEDPPDFRDHIYRPTLRTVRAEVIPATENLPPVFDQSGEASCVGFALANAINIDLMRAGRTRRASPRMLYEMARLHDEFAFDDVSGSSLRGAIKGFYHNGVCSETVAPYQAGQFDWRFTIAAAKDARGISLGAYYRLKPSIPDFQSALNETGAIVVSSYIHSGWIKHGKRAITRIPLRKKRIGTHAFAIIGYDSKGFLVLNSWGEQWANFEDLPGVAHWSYEDWGENIIDAWVLRMASSAPKAFNITAKVERQNIAQKDAKHSLLHLPLPRRNQLLGHSVEAEQTRIVGSGRTGMSLDSLRETALYLASEKGRKKYPHLMFVFHDPFMGKDTISRLSGHLIAPFKAAGIYPIHILFGLDEIVTAKLRLKFEAETAKKRIANTSETIDEYLLLRARHSCKSLIESFAQHTQLAACEGYPLWQILASVLIEAGDGRSTTILSAGTGSLIADAVYTLENNAMFENFPVRDLRIEPVSAPQMRRKSDMIWSLGQKPLKEPELHGYSAEWQDLVRSVLQRDFVMDGAKPLNNDSQTLAAAMASSYFGSQIRRAVNKNVH